MLLQFSVSNFKSIKDEITLSLEATSLNDLEHHLIKENDDNAYLPIAVLYGPNGGGKSNILEAINALLFKIISPINMIASSKKMFLNPIKIKPFSFDKDTVNQPTKFDLVFKTKLNEYHYRLEILNDNVLNEELDLIKFDTMRATNLFTRNESKTKINSSYSSHFKNESTISTTLPYLSFLMIMYNNNPIVQDLYDYFLNRLEVYDYGNPQLELMIMKLDDQNDSSKKIKDLMLQMFKEMDIDISNFEYKKEPYGLDIITHHSLENDDYTLRFNEESSGTQKLFKILPLIVASLIKGGTLIIDELDAKLHPSLLRYIIELYTNLEINKNKSQIIFSSHDLSSMNNETFRRDEIYFAMKDDNKSTVLYSLAELNVRKDAKYDKQYLEGKYGADPYVKRILNWENKL